jgi:hypothetical protein
MTLDFTPLKKMRAHWGSASMWAYMVCAIRSMDWHKAGNDALAEEWMIAAGEWVPPFPIRLLSP